MNRLKQTIVTVVSALALSACSAAAQHDPVYWQYYEEQSTIQPQDFDAFLHTVEKDLLHNYNITKAVVPRLENDQLFSPPQQEKSRWIKAFYGMLHTNEDALITVFPEDNNAIEYGVTLEHGTAVLYQVNEETPVPEELLR